MHRLGLLANEGRRSKVDRLPGEVNRGPVIQGKGQHHRWWDPESEMVWQKCRTITVSPMWGITTSVGIPRPRPSNLKNPKSGILPLIPIRSALTAQFHSALHWRPLIFSWTMTRKRTKTAVSPTLSCQLKKEGLPTSLTICLSLTVEAWTKYINPQFFNLLDEECRERWLFAEITFMPTYTGFDFQFKDSHFIRAPSYDLFFQLQCTAMDQNVLLYQPWPNFRQFHSQNGCRVLGNFTLSEQDVVDETYLFKGSQNSLILTQSYTHDFQCVYQLERHPFDTQVRFGNFFSNHRCLSRNCWYPSICLVVLGQYRYCTLSLILYDTVVKQVHEHTPYLSILGHHQTIRFRKRGVPKSA